MSGIRRAVVYARVSTEDQAQNGTSLEAQEQSCLRKVCELGAVVAEVVRDEGVSGALYAARPGIQRALTLVEAGGADVLVVYSVDRLSRDPEHLENVRKRLKTAGADLVVVTLPVEDTPEGELMLGVNGNFGRYERAVIKRRTTGGSRRLAESGVQPSRGMVAYGYTLITAAHVLRGEYPAGTQGTYTVRDDQAHIVRWIFEQYAGGSHSLYGLVRELNDRGVPTQRGARWAPETVRSMLKNPIYKGCASWGRHENLTDDTRTARGLKTTYRRLRAEPTVVLPCPPLVPETVWQACQERLSTNQSRLSGNPNSTFLLSSVARCPVCGRGLQGVRSEGSYRCNRKVYEAHVPSRHFKADTLERDFLRVFREAAKQPESIREAFEARREARAGAVTTDADALRDELALLDRRESAAARAQVQALMDGRSPGPYEDILREVTRRREVVRAELAAAAQAAQHEAEVTTSSSDAAAFALEAISTLDRVLRHKGIGTAEKRRLIQTVVEEVVPTLDGLRVTLRPGCGASTIKNWQ